MKHMINYHKQIQFSQLFTRTANNTSESVVPRSSRLNSVQKEERRVIRLIGLYRLRSATFEQLSTFEATFCGSSNLEQVLPFWVTFEQILPGLEYNHIKHEKGNNFIENFKLFKILECLSTFPSNCSFDPLDLRVSLIFSPHICEQLSKAKFWAMTDVSQCQEM